MEGLILKERQKNKKVPKKQKPSAPETSNEMKEEQNYPVVEEQEDSEPKMGID
jgi:hypothetical protein